MNLDKGYVRLGAEDRPATLGFQSERPTAGSREAGDLRHFSAAAPGAMGHWRAAEPPANGHGWDRPITRRPKNYTFGVRLPGPLGVWMLTQVPVATTLKEFPW